MKVNVTYNPKEEITMAKAAKEKKKDAVEKASNGGKITVGMLSEQLGVEPRILRQFIRAQGFKAPEVKQEGFGPRAKYEWDADSKELKTIIKAWQDKDAASGE
jgi:hypothetical protein